MRVFISRFFSSTALILWCLALASCSTPKIEPSNGNSDIVKITRFWRPYLLYIQASPYPRLYVEVDAVAGCEPSEATLNGLHDFLTLYCKKPGGIQIVRRDVIPIEAARGIQPRALAREFLKGPPENGAKSTAAFMYLLFYDGKLIDQPGIARTGHGDAKAPSGPRGRNRNPQTDLLPYPAAFINARYGERRVNNDLLLHETGHLLGLVSRRTNAAGFHCLDTTCLMNQALRLHVSRLLLGRDPIIQHHLCALCVAELQASAKAPAPANLRFVGPVLVRSEDGYHVLNLPFRVKVIVGDLTEQDCRDFAAAVNAEKPSPGDDDEEWRADALVKEEALRDAAKLRAVLARAKADPYEPVQLVVTRMWVQAFAQWYYSINQLSNVVNVCHQAILLNSRDDWSYNQLAWIKATCSDALIRNGQEAVFAASQACELTKWKEWNPIDTLAAAYAESGDFKRAVAFEQQALHTGQPGESDRKAMDQRIVLFRQGRPFREKAARRP